MDNVLSTDSGFSQVVVEYVHDTPSECNVSLEGQQAAVSLLISKLHKIVPCEFPVLDCGRTNRFPPNGMSGRRPCMKHYELLRFKALEGLTEYLISCMPLASSADKQRGQRWFKDIPFGILNCAYRECLLFEVLCYAQGLADLNLGSLATGLQELAEHGLRPHVERSTTHYCGYCHRWRDGFKDEFWHNFVRATDGSA